MVNLDIIPQQAQAGLEYDIVGAGWQYAKISENASGEKTIVFIGASGSTPIILKIYSLFNPDVVAYVEIHTLFGLSELTANSGLVNKLNKDLYELTIYTGESATLLTINAENIAYSETFKTLFEVDGIENFINILFLCFLS